MKKLLIAGGCGFVGSCLVKLALKKKYKILNIDKLNYASRKLKISNKNYSFKKVNLGDVKKLEKIFNNFKPNYVINCAAESHVDRSIESPKVFFDSNTIGTVNLLYESIKYKNLRFLQISTDEVFGSLSKKQKKFDEKSKYKPNSPYSASKAAADHAVRSFGETYNLDYIITNSSNNFGPFQYPEKLIPVVINSLMNKAKIPIYGKGLNFRDWIYVEDHVDAILLCLEKGKSKNTYLIGANTELTNLELVKQIIKEYQKITKERENLNKLISFVEDRKSHDFRYAINNNKIRKTLKWRTKNNFRDNLIQTIKFYIKNKHIIKHFYSNDAWLKRKYTQK